MWLINLHKSISRTKTNDVYVSAVSFCFNLFYGNVNGISELAVINPLIINIINYLSGIYKHNASLIEIKSSLNETSAAYPPTPEPIAIITARQAER